MRRKPCHSATALLCVILASLLSACTKDDIASVDIEKQAFDDLRSDIRIAVTDSTRESKAIDMVGVLEQDLADLRTSIKVRKERVSELNANYDTPRADFEAFLADVEKEVRENRRRVSDSYKTFLANVTPEERSAIAKTHTKAMNSAIRTIQAI